MRKMAAIVLGLSLTCGAEAQTTGPIPVVCKGASVTLGVSTSSSNIALPSSSPNCRVVTLINDGTVEVFYATGTSGVTAAVPTAGVPGNNVPLLPGVPVSVWITDGFLAAITVSSTALLRIIQSSGKMTSRNIGGGGSAPPPPVGSKLLVNTGVALLVSDGAALLVQ